MMRASISDSRMPEPSLDKLRARIRSQLYGRETVLAAGACSCIGAFIGAAVAVWLAALWRQ